MAALLDLILIILKNPDSFHPEPQEVMNGAISERKPSAQNGNASAKLRKETHITGNVDVHPSIRIVLYPSVQ